MRDNLDRQQQPITAFQRQLVNENTVIAQRFLQRRFQAEFEKVPFH